MSDNEAFNRLYDLVGQRALKDGLYEYDALALPFWADLGEALARELLVE